MTLSVGEIGMFFLLKVGGKLLDAGGVLSGMALSVMFRAGGDIPLSILIPLCSSFSSSSSTPRKFFACLTPELAAFLITFGGGGGGGVTGVFGLTCLLSFFSLLFAADTVVVEAAAMPSSLKPITIPVSFTPLIRSLVERLSLTSTRLALLLSLGSPSSLLSPPSLFSSSPPSLPSLLPFGSGIFSLLTTLSFLFSIVMPRPEGAAVENLAPSPLDLEIASSFMSPSGPKHSVPVASLTLLTTLTS
mmetsp:Transcript_3458/g.7005  ORF Transcript_3458/g.7005 Transcript_3458/m.7005 type:complete len:246 (+) Transcript_3458:206-943(+)